MKFQVKANFMFSQYGSHLHFSGESISADTVFSLWTLFLNTCYPIAYCYVMFAYLLVDCSHQIHPGEATISCYTEKLVLSWMESDMVIHNGGCHCRRVRWRVQAPSSVVAWNCNCSDCSMRGNTHFIVPSEKFELLGDSKEFLTTYTFGTHTAKHTFCKFCGITSFYIPRSNPDGVAVTFRCVDPGTLTHVEIKHYDGRNWESSYNQTGIASCSQGTDWIVTHSSTTLLCFPP